MKLSIIIPTHNNEDTIGKTLNSILSQDSVDIEVLVILNGCHDGTEIIVKKFCLNFPNISMYWSDVGVSNARNKGIKKAKGDWILFIDADDQLTGNAISDYLKSISRHVQSELILFNYIAGHEEINLSKMINVDQAVSYNSIFNALLSNPTKCMTVWNKLFKSSIINKHSLLFDPSLVYSEDSEFLIRYLKVVSDVLIINKYTYRYIPNVNSTVNSFNDSLVHEYTKSINKIIYDLEGNTAQKNALNDFILIQINLMMVHYVFVKKHTSFYSKLREMRFVINSNPILQNAVKNLKFRIPILSRFVPLLCYKSCFYILAGLAFQFRAFQNTHRK